VVVGFVLQLFAAAPPLPAATARGAAATRAAALIEAFRLAFVRRTAVRDPALVPAITANVNRLSLSRAAVAAVRPQLSFAADVGLVTDARAVGDMSVTSGTRPQSSMSPAVVLGPTWAVVATAGGSGGTCILTAFTQVLLGALAGTEAVATRKGGAPARPTAVLWGPWGETKAVAPVGATTVVSDPGKSGPFSVALQTHPSAVSNFSAWWLPVMTRR